VTVKFVEWLKMCKKRQNRVWKGASCSETNSSLLSDSVEEKIQV